MGEGVLETVGDQFVDDQTTGHGEVDAQGDVLDLDGEADGAGGAGIGSEEVAGQVADVVGKVNPTPLMP
jgi:hypothetical protein